MTFLHISGLWLRGYLQALFADAPVDSDMFMSYLHQNYPPFCDGIHNCVNMMDYLSISDSLMRMEGDIVRTGKPFHNHLAD